jgi:hypothetical protein
MWERARRVEMRASRKRTELNDDVPNPNASSSTGTAAGAATA